MISTILVSALLSVASQHAMHAPPRAVPSVIENQDTLKISLSECEQFHIQKIVTNNDHSMGQDVTQNALKKSSRSACEITIPTTHFKTFTKITVELEESSTEALSPQPIFIIKEGTTFTQTTEEQFLCSQPDILCNENGLQFVGSEENL